MQSTRARNGKQRQRLFSITFLIEGIRYWVIPLRDADPAVARKAFRFKKRDAADRVVATYDVRVTPEGHVECDCPGFLRWRHCKHVETLEAAGMVEGPSYD